MYISMFVIAWVISIVSYYLKKDIEKELYEEDEEEEEETWVVTRMIITNDHSICVFALTRDKLFLFIAVCTTSTPPNPQQPLTAG